MILIIGGAYQGKLDYAKSAFHLSDGDVFACTGAGIDFSKQCINHIEEFTFAHPDPVGYFRENREKWHDSILICQDISSGVVPMGADMRAWRQKNGRLCQYLAGEAEQISRVFCGLEQRLK